jgi:hypothetical protein
MTKYVRKPPQMWYKLVINLESWFIPDILPSDAARPQGQYISYKPPSRFITLTYKATYACRLFVIWYGWKSNYCLPLQIPLPGRYYIPGVPKKTCDVWLYVR